VNPFPIILSSPSGAGKTTISRALLERRQDLGYSVSCTTRPARAGEEEGKDYFFMRPEAFDEARERGAFAEAANVHGQQYGTLRSEVERVLGSGRHVLMDIDVQGTRQFVSAFPQSVLIFILPPSAEALVARLEGRGSEDRERLAKRLKSAMAELEAVTEYGYVVVNEDVETATARVSEIIDAEAARVSRQREISGVVQKISAGISRKLDEIQKGQN
jgi:guanylate kinase